MLRLSLLTCLAALPLFPAEAAKAVQWSRWELSLDGAVDSVVFTGPGGRRLAPPGFSPAGDRIFRVAFPAAGKWQWKASDGRSGEVRVSRYSGTNPLYRHGFLRVADSKRHLAHADGTPFLWMGDTAWYAGAKASTEEWRDYIADRAAKGFTLVQISAVRGPATPGVPQAFGPDGAPDPAYWENFDAKVKHANDHGIVLLIVGLGRPTLPTDEPRVARPEFARYVVARYFGDHVIFSPSFDGQYSELYDIVGANLRSFTPIHLITQHPGTRKGLTERYVPNPYLDFSALQSGHHNGKLDAAYTAAREWPLSVWSLDAVKPVVNAEGMYDGRGSDEGPAWRAKDVRKIGWLSWLSGGLGYTYGAGETDRKVPGTNGGVWGWNQNEGAWDHWRKAAAWDSSRQMQVLSEFFRSIEWWRLKPAHDAVIEGGSSATERAVFAVAADGSFGVAYTPVRQKIVLELNRLSRPVRAVWVDAATGVRHEMPGRIPNKATHAFTPPDSGEDWALLLGR